MSPRYQPVSQDDLAPSGEKTRIRANIAAIKLLRTLIADDRPATNEEQAVLARWSSWGAVPKIFDENEPDLAPERAELRALLTDDEWYAAIATTRNAHYTDASIVQPIWNALEQLGIASGRILEPGCGSGNFIAFASDNVQMTGIELDPLTARITAVLYPDATIRHESFVDTRLPEGYYDAAIGNVPFDDAIPTDPIHNPLGLSLHNYFITKTLNLVRPGGLVAVLTSRYTMDARGKPNTARAEIAAMADLVGAVRLPEGAHMRAAGTDVVTDLLILRRREPGQEKAEGPFLELDAVESEGTRSVALVNSYFAEHPEMVLGKHTYTSGPYGDRLTVLPHPDTNLAESLSRALGQIIESAAERGLRTSDLDLKQRREADVVAEQMRQASERFGSELARFEGTIADNGDGTFSELQEGRIVPHPCPKTQVSELRALLSLRDAYRTLIEAETEATEYGIGEEKLDDLRHQLNLRYDSYTNQFGLINRVTVNKSGGKLRPGQGGFRHDPYAAGVYALEDYDPDTDTARKAAIFEQRGISPRVASTTAETPADAVAICLGEHNEIRLTKITSLLELGSEDEARQALGNLVFDDPETERLVPAAEYLSGNVRAKLAEAEAAVLTHPEGHRFKSNVAALRDVLPEDKTPGEIEVRFGSPWIDPRHYEAFLQETLNDRRIKVRRLVGADWKIEAAAEVRSSDAATKVFGTKERDATDIAQRLLRGSALLIPAGSGGPDETKAAKRARKRAAAKATEEVQTKADELNRQFVDWLWRDGDRTTELIKTYNELFNSHVHREYDGSRLLLPGLTKTLRPHQLAAVARALSEPGTVFDHEVGFGKTLELIVSAMEMRRLGIVRKPAIVVPNQVLAQFRSEFLMAYPNARVLAGAEEDFKTPEMRKRFVSRIANGDWDSVILSESVFERIPLSASGQDRYIAEETRHVREAIGRAAEDGSNRRFVKQMQGELVRLTERLKRSLVKASDAGISWEQTGCDGIFKDEFHRNSNLFVATHNQELKLSNSGRASDLHMKNEYTRRVYGPRGVIGASGTTIPNSIVQSYVALRLYRPDLLEEQDLVDFDSFRGQYLKSEVGVEVSVTGTVRVKERIAGFRNRKDFSRLWRVMADVKTSDDIQLDVPALVGGGPRTVLIPATDEDRAFMAELDARMEAIGLQLVEPEEDNPLTVTNHGRLYALDPRLIGRPVGSSGTTKVEVAADEISKIYEEHLDAVYTDLMTGEPLPVPGALQLVFADLGTPSDEARKQGRFVVYEALRDELVARGIPRERIRFIQDAKTSREKEALFKDCRAGKVSVVMGSTESLGTGVNIQYFAVATHHLDPHWKPAGIGQRNGRVPRQGNQNKTVHELRYVKEASVDAYMWQTVQRKIRGNLQVRTGRDVGEGEVETDLDRDFLTSNELKAIATGNPLLLEKAAVDDQIRKLEAAQTSWQQTRAHHSHVVMTADSAMRAAQAKVGAVDDAVAKRVPTKGDEFSMRTHDGALVETRLEAAAALRTKLGWLRSFTRSQRLLHSHAEHAGTLGGLSVSVTIDLQYDSASFTIENLPEAKVFVGDLVDLLREEKPPIGLIQRLENQITRLDEVRAVVTEKADRLLVTIENSRQALEKPFEHASTLSQARAKQAHLDAQINGEAIGNSDWQEPERSEEPADLVDEAIADAVAFAELSERPIENTRSYDSVDAALQSMFGSPAESADPEPEQVSPADTYQDPQPVGDALSPEEAPDPDIDEEPAPVPVDPPLQLPSGNAFRTTKELRSSLRSAVQAGNVLARNPQWKNRSSGKRDLDQAHQRLKTFYNAFDPSEVVGEEIYEASLELAARANEVANDLAPGATYANAVLDLNRLATEFAAGLLATRNLGETWSSLFPPTVSEQAQPTAESTEDLPLQRTMPPEDLPLGQAAPNEVAESASPPRTTSASDPLAGEPYLSQEEALADAKAVFATYKRVQSASSWLRLRDQEESPLRPVIEAVMAAWEETALPPALFRRPLPEVALSEARFARAIRDLHILLGTEQHHSPWIQERIAELTPKTRLLSSRLAATADAIAGWDELPRTEAEKDQVSLFTEASLAGEESQEKETMEPEQPEASEPTSHQELARRYEQEAVERFSALSATLDRDGAAEIRRRHESEHARFRLVWDADWLIQQHAEALAAAWVETASWAMGGDPNAERSADRLRRELTERFKIPLTPVATRNNRIAEALASPKTPAEERIPVGVWSRKIQINDSLTSPRVMGTDFKGDPPEIREELKANRFEWRKSYGYWEYAGKPANRDAAVAAVWNVLVELDERDADQKQEPKAKFPPTAQQQAIIDHVVRGEDLRVLALAGTGKTTTMVAVADALTTKKITYIAFNKTIKEEAEGKFRQGVTVVTSHGLAYRALRAEGTYADKLRRVRKGATADADIVRILGVKDFTTTADGQQVTYPATELARWAMATVKKYRESSSEEITTGHLPPGMNSRGQLAQQVLGHAKAAWANIADPDNWQSLVPKGKNERPGAIRFGDDDYLKIYALTKSKIDADLIIFDEAQDINPVTADLIQRQEAQTVVVGDSHQSIYGFRGAVDAIRNWPAPALPITKSFRFGPKIAELGNMFLQHLKADLVLEGNEALDTRLVTEQDRPRTDAILCRTNFGAITAIEAGRSDGRRVALAGGGDELVEVAKAAQALKQGRRTRHPDFEQFGSWQDVVTYVGEHPEEKGLATFVNLIERKSPEGLLRLLAELVDENDPDPAEDSKLVVSTAHKAKGREWNHVVIADDFRGPQTGVDDDGNEITILPEPEEFRLSYVTVTRAQQSLDLGGLSWILDHPASGAASPARELDEQSATISEPPVPQPEPEAVPLPVEEEAAYPELIIEHHEAATVVHGVYDDDKLHFWLENGGFSPVGGDPTKWEQPSRYKIITRGRKVSVLRRLLTNNSRPVAPTVDHPLDGSDEPTAEPSPPEEQPAPTQETATILPDDNATVSAIPVSPFTDADIARVLTALDFSDFLSLLSMARGAEAPQTHAFGGYSGSGLNITLSADGLDVRIQGDGEAIREDLLPWQAATDWLRPGLHPERARVLQQAEMGSKRFARTTGFLILGEGELQQQAQLALWQIARDFQIKIVKAARDFHAGGKPVPHDQVMSEALAPAQRVRDLLSVLPPVGGDDILKPISEVAENDLIKINPSSEDLVRVVGIEKEGDKARLLVQDPLNPPGAPSSEERPLTEKVRLAILPSSLKPLMGVAQPTLPAESHPPEERPQLYLDDYIHGRPPQNAEAAAAYESWARMDAEAAEDWVEEASVLTPAEGILDPPPQPALEELKDALQEFTEQHPELQAAAAAEELDSSSTAEADDDHAKHEPFPEIGAPWDELSRVSYWWEDGSRTEYDDIYAIPPAIPLVPWKSMESGAEPGVSSGPAAAPDGLAELAPAFQAATDASSWYHDTPQWQHMQTVWDATSALFDAVKNALKGYWNEFRENLRARGILSTVAARAARTIGAASGSLTRLLERAGLRDSIAWKATRGLRLSAADFADQLMGCIPPGRTLRSLQGIKATLTDLRERLSNSTDDGPPLPSLGLSALDANITKASRALGPQANDPSWRTAVGLWAQARQTFADFSTGAKIFTVDVETLGQATAVWMRVCEVVSDTATNLLNRSGEDARDTLRANALRVVRHSAEQYLAQVRGDLPPGRRVPLGTFDQPAPRRQHAASQPRPSAERPKPEIERPPTSLPTDVKVAGPLRKGEGSDTEIAVSFLSNLNPEKLLLKGSVPGSSHALPKLDTPVTREPAER